MGNIYRKPFFLIILFWVASLKVFIWREPWISSLTDKCAVHAVASKFLTGHHVVAINQMWCYSPISCCNLFTSHPPTQKFFMLPRIVFLFIVEIFTFVEDWKMPLWIYPKGFGSESSSRFDLYSVTNLWHFILFRYTFIVILLQNSFVILHFLDTLFACDESEPKQ